MLAVSCLVLCAACLSERPDPGATGRAQAVDMFSARPGDESFRITMPVRLNVLDISEDRVLVQAKGTHDETLIEIYPIER